MGNTPTPSPRFLVLLNQPIPRSEFPPPAFPGSDLEAVGWGVGTEAEVHRDAKAGHLLETLGKACPHPPVAV